MPRAPSAAAVASMARSSIWPPAPCAQTNTAFTCSGSGFRRRLQLVDETRHDALEERLLRLLVEPYGFAGAQAPHDLGARQLEHVLAAAIGEEVARLLRADEQQLRRAVLLAVALRAEFHPGAHFHVRRRGHPRRRLHPRPGLPPLAPGDRPRPR